MALSGTLGADFKVFDAACTASEAKLSSLGAAGVRTGADVAKLALVTEQGVHPFNNLRGSLTQFDGALAAVGLNVGPQIRAIGELGDVAGKTATEVGLLGTAGLALATGMASFQLTGAVLEFTGLGKALADGDNALHDWGIAAETAGAVQDTITKAIRNGADATISYTDAIKFNQAAHEAWKGPIDAAAKLAAFSASLKQTAFDAEHLTMAEKDLVAEALAVGIGVTKIADALGLSRESVDLYVTSMEATAKAEALAAAEAEKLAAKLPPVADTITTVAHATLSAADATTVWNTGLVIQTGVIAQVDDSLDALILKLDASAASFLKLGHRTSNLDGSEGSDLGKSYVRSLSEFDPAVVAMYRDMGFEDWQILNMLLNLATPWDYQATIDAKKTGGKAGGAGPMTKAGAATGAGGSPAALSAGLGGITVTVNNNISGVFDAAAKAAITKVTEEGITRGILQARKLGAR